MPSMQIVFLFDLNAYTTDGVNIDADFNRKLLCLRLTCLRILTHYFAIEPNLKWGFKFFDSRGSLTQTMNTFSFSDVSLGNFETLENEITIRYQRHISYLEALSTSALNDELSDTNKISDTSKSCYPVQVLQLALTQVLCEFQWSSDQMSMFSPSKNNHNHLNKNDILFLVTKCPRNEQLFLEYFGSDLSCLTPGKFSKSLLTHSLHEQLLLKLSILWIWLDTNCGNSKGNFICQTEEVLSKISDSLKSLKCSLIPISVLDNSPSVLKCDGSATQAIRMDLKSSLMPFSDIISQSIKYQFYSNSKGNPGEAVIHFQDKEMYVHLEKMSIQTNSMKWNEPEHGLFEKVNSLTWSKFDFHFALPKSSSTHTYGNFLCLPAVYGNDKNYVHFQHLNKNLILKSFNMFITCESTCGVKLPGLFSALTDTSGLISIMSPNKLFQKSSVSLNFLTSTNNEESNSKEKCSRPFQIECLEPWFKPPTNLIRAILPPTQEPQNRSFLKSFYKKVSSQFSKQQKIATEKENIAPENGDNEENPSQPSEAFEVSNLRYDELISLLKGEYDLALNTSHSVLQSAKKIVKTAFSFFKLKSSDTHSSEDALKDFLKEFFTMSHDKIAKKYEKSEEDDKKRQESKLQILLALETEILAPHSERLELIKNITSYFYRMSFFMSASEQIQFFQDVLRENYEDTLHDIVVELSEELDIPLSEMDEDSTYETSEPPSSESMLGSNNSRMSVLSVKSSSGSSSRAENRKVVCRNDIMNNIKSRQFLLTRSSPRKKKYKNLCPGAENIPIRYSPRLSSKRRKERNLNCSMNAINVRRNLFPKDQKPSTPKYSRSPYKRKRMRTPKSHHVLKTKFVPETPTSKQNLSALQRRKSFMDTDDSETSLTEIAESPKINKSAKNTAQCELLKQLNELETNKFVQPEPQPVPSCSFHSQYTPESKRRLSLKLFSKYLTSPTARTGLRKCSKRLFDQVSPHVEKETSKRLKVDTELDNMPLQEFPNQEETPKKS